MNRKGLSCHVKVAHKTSFADYVVKHELLGVRPVCVCGCGQETSFFGGKFMLYAGAHYHVGRPKTPEHKEKIGKAQLGRKLSQVHKDRIRDGVTAAHADDPTIAERSATANTGRGVSVETRRKISLTRSAKIATGDIVINANKISDTVSRLYVEGGFAWAKGVHVSSKTNHQHVYRSSWELVLYVDLDEDPSVATYETEFTRITYEFHGTKHWYIPDVHVTYNNAKHELIEIKPLNCRSIPVNIAKRRAAEAFCADRGWSYRLWPDADITEAFIEKFMAERAAKEVA